MTLGKSLHVIGTAAQLVGLLVVASGVRELRRSYAAERPGFEDRAIKAAGHVWAAVRRAGARVLRAVLRRPPPTPRHVMLAGLSRGVGHSEAILEVGYGPLDSSLSFEEQVAQLDGRTREIRTATTRLERLDRDHKKALLEVTNLLNDTRTSMQIELHGEIRKLATEGLSRQTLGLLITAAGTVLAAFS